ncbi:MAG: hypothetical protein OHK0012_24900 [Synechococcales cyanobacterium]
MAALAVGCSQDGYLARLEMTVAPAPLPGHFLVSGSTTLPVDSIILVDALRYLNYPGQPSSDPIFAVLARQEVVVRSDYQWQTILVTAPNGKEVWQQRYADVTPPVQPLGEEIIFRATWLPDNQPLAVQSIIGGQGQELRGLQLLNTGRSQYVRTYVSFNALPPDQLPSPTPSPDPMRKWRLEQDPLIYRYHRYY